MAFTDAVQSSLIGTLDGRWYVRLEENGFDRVSASRLAAWRHLA